MSTTGGLLLVQILVPDEGIEVKSCSHIALFLSWKCGSARLAPTCPSADNDQPLSIVVAQGVSPNRSSGVVRLHVMEVLIVVRKRLGVHELSAESWHD